MGLYLVPYINELGPDVVLNTKYIKKVGSHNGSLSRSMTQNQIDHYDETKKSAHG